MQYWKRLVLFIGSLVLAAVPVLAAGEGKRFATPEEATEALVSALEAQDQKALLVIFGKEAKPLIASSDPLSERERRQAFLEAYGEAHSFTEPDPSTRVLELGSDKFPFAIPLVKDEGGWRFDTAAGEEELLARRIGHNELATIQACLAYVDAQREYYARKPMGEPMRYAQRIASNKGKRDGLYWTTADGEDPSPLGDLFANASMTPVTGDKTSRPYFGYRYRILTRQGPNAAGGAFDYIAHGKMIGGFALIAYPADYGLSGVMTFLVNHDGVVFEKDLGAKTAKEAAAIDSFNPDDSWKRIPQGAE